MNHHHQLIELSPTSVVVYQTNTLTLNCPGQQKTLPGCKFCVVNLPCKCALFTQSLYLSPRLVHCYNLTQDVSVLHPVNLALLQEFFNNTEFNTVLADTFFAKEVQMKIPNFNIYTHNMNKILAADQETHLSLRKMANAAKNDKTIFKSLTEPLLSGDITLESIWPDLNAIKGPGWLNELGRWI